MVEVLHVRGVESIDISLYDHGGTGKPLLFTHAASFCARMWDPVIASLRSSGLDNRIFSVDMRGHGGSQLAEGELFDWHLAAADLVSVVEMIRQLTDTADPIPAVGHSMGGTCLMMSQISDSSLFSKIWAFEPILFDQVNEERRAVTEQLIEGARRRKDYFESKEVAAERFRSKPPMMIFDPACFNAFVEFGLIETDEGSFRLSCRPEVEASVYEQAGTGVTAKLEELTAPVRFLVGANDGDRVPAILGLSESEFHEIVEIERGHHFTPFAEPHRLADDIETWL